MSYAVCRAENIALTWFSLSAKTAWVLSSPVPRNWKWKNTDLAAAAQKWGFQEDKEVQRFSRAERRAWASGMGRQRVEAGTGTPLGVNTSSMRFSSLSLSHSHSLSFSLSLSHTHTLYFSLSLFHSLNMSLTFQSLMPSLHLFLSFSASVSLSVLFGSSWGNLTRMCIMWVLTPWEIRK